MLVYHLVTALLDFVNWFVGQLPLGSGSQYVVPTSWIATAQGYMGFVGRFVDLQALGFALTLLVSYYTATFVIRAIIWLYHVVRP